MDAVVSWLLFFWPSQGNGASHIQSVSPLLSQSSLETLQHTKLEVCLLGDSESIQVHGADVPHTLMEPE